MNSHRMESGNKEAGELHCDFIGVVPLARLHIRTGLVGDNGTYNLEISVFEIEWILNCILLFKYL